jgi:hypothetical protein
MMLGPDEELSIENGNLESLDYLVRPCEHVLRN